MVSKGLQGEIWAGGGDQGHVRTALVRRYAHAMGGSAHRSLLAVIVDRLLWPGFAHRRVRVRVRVRVTIEVGLMVRVRVRARVRVEGEAKDTTTGEDGGGVRE